MGGEINSRLRRNAVTYFGCKAARTVQASHGEPDPHELHDGMVLLEKLFTWVVEMNRLVRKQKRVSKSKQCFVSDCSFKLEWNRHCRQTLKQNTRLSTEVLQADITTDVMVNTIENMATKWNSLEDHWHTQSGFLLWHTAKQRKDVLEVVEVRAFNEFGEILKKFVEVEIEIAEYEDKGIDQDADLAELQWPVGDSVNWIVDIQEQLDLIRGNPDWSDGSGLQLSPAIVACVDLLTVCTNAKCEAENNGDIDGDYWQDRMPFSLEDDWFTWNDEKHSTDENFLEIKKSFEAYE